MNKMRRFIFPMIVLLVGMIVTSCGSSKKVAYFQNADSVSLAASRMLYDAKIMPKDQLTITVITTDPNASAPFNLSVSRTSGTNSNLLTTQSALQGYLVDNEGNINFPVVGKLHVVGLTKNQCEDMIREKVKPYLAASENPVVTVTMASYRITVLGEVNHPSVVPVTTEKMSILEAIAQAGDLSIYGKRGNVMLIREDAHGEKSVHRLNLNDANLINSPYYYLQQNDVIYVEPNSQKKLNADVGTATNLAFTLVSMGLSIASLVVNILR